MISDFQNTYIDSAGKMWKFSTKNINDSFQTQSVRASHMVDKV